MDRELKPIGKDAGGYDVLTAAIKSLLNQFPGLYPDEEVMFEELGEEKGIAFSNDTGALVYAETGLAPRGASGLKFPSSIHSPIDILSHFIL